MYTLDNITQAYNQTFLEGGSKPGIVTQMQWDTLNCDNHSQQVYHANAKGLWDWIGGTLDSGNVHSIYYMA